ncbi:tail fiber domain-containing protein [Robinsoniella peoriensis]|uniref:tail fiber domain-containing protein n=1 Tax=Robinsoniella peoriensis TaxID=180332 RepID=UPI003630D9FA
MVNTSLEYRKALYEDKRSFIPKVNILLSNGTVLELSGNQIMQGGVKIDDGVSSPGSFDIGSAVIGKLTLNINNMQDEYSDYNFTDAVVTVFVGLQLESRIEWLKKGVFNADDPTSTQSVITLECLDNMSKFDKKYDGKLIFPANLQTIVNYCCSKCGVILNTNQFDNYTYRVNKSPFEVNEPVTYREILSYCAQIAGCYARCNVDGRLELKWYDTTAFDITDTLDGGNFIDYTAVDVVDGGNYTNYSATDVIDGGTFEDLKKYHHIYSLSSINISTDDVVITGISVTAADGKNSKGEEVAGETVLNGDLGYVLKIENNPLIECGMASNVASYLGAKIRGMRFRPMNISALSDPSIEAGDCAIITDRKNNSYYCYITNLTYAMGGYESFSCDAETPARNSSQRYSEMTKAVVESRKNTQKQLSQYDLVAQQFGTLMANGMGLYRTTEEKNGSLIYYMHNQPLLKDSKTIWKMTEGAFSVSTDGGLSWNAGIDKNGNVLATVLTAIGINADWINAGKIKGIEIEGVTITGSTFKNASGTFEIDNDGLLHSYSKSKKTELSLGNAGITVSGRTSEEPGVRESYGLRCIDYANKRGAMYNSSGIYMYIDRGAGIELDTVFNVDLVARYMYCYCDATFFYPFTIFNDLYVSGKITTNGLVNNSDPRLKDIESHITNAECLLKKLETIIFRWKDGDDKKLHMGLNADNVQEVFGDEYGIVTEGREGYKGVSYIEIIPPLVSAVNNHSERINRNEERLDRIEKRLDRIENKLDKLLEGA